ncbi:126bcc80-389a-4953-80d0-299f458c0ebf [Sclerotinia trifoliorum]|uniref:126bcc80-389a-4953-80d0-299f458c0ebf n=1 Tax=Sclerotinia trifoliorum TaxID=28548 RepID=A0A8H2W5E8_9HELO|nr:126bcc80-389a-4953-80d0-299f458c0ebf [Sclerotinia trifoliorum]
MHVVAITSFVAALMGTVTAQTSSVVNLYLMGFDDGGDDQAPFVGSIIASDATATTYSITCGSTTTTAASTSAYFGYENDCGIPDSFTFTQGPSTIAYVYTIDYAFDITMTETASASAPTGSGHAEYEVGCVISGSSSAFCTGINIESSGTSTISSDASTTVTGTDFSSLLSGIPVTITAGFASTTSSATPTTSGASATGVSATGSSKSSASASSSASGSAASTGGMPMITAKAQWVVGGAAAALVMAAL